MVVRSVAFLMVSQPCEIFRSVAETDPGLSSLKGPSTNGQIYSFTTQCADKNGTPLSIDLGDQLAAGLEGPEVLNYYLLSVNGRAHFLI